MQRRRSKTALRMAVVLAKGAYDRHYAIPLSHEAGVAKKDAYAILVRMRDDGWLAEGWEPQPPSERGQPWPARRFYTLTDVGRQELVTFLGDLAPPLPPRPAPTAASAEFRSAPDRMVLMNEKEASHVGSLDTAIPFGEDARLVRVCAEDWPRFTQRLAEVDAVAVATNATYINDTAVYAVVPAD